MQWTLSLNERSCLQLALASPRQHTASIFGFQGDTRFPAPPEAKGVPKATQEAIVEKRGQVTLTSLPFQPFPLFPHPN